MTKRIERRAFITLLGGAALACPLAARADHQSQDRQRLGLTMPTALLVRADEVIE